MKPTVLIYGSLLSAVLLWSPLLERGLAPDARQLGWLAGAVVAHLPARGKVPRAHREVGARGLFLSA